MKPWEKSAPAELKPAGRSADRPFVAESALIFVVSSVLKILPTDVILSPNTVRCILYKPENINVSRDLNFWREKVLSEFLWRRRLGYNC